MSTTASILCRRFRPSRIDLSTGRRRRRRKSSSQTSWYSVLFFIFMMSILLSSSFPTGTTTRIAEAAAVKSSQECHHGTNVCRVLPPSPDDDATPMCTTTNNIHDSSLIHSRCSPERYCAPIITNSKGQVEVLQEEEEGEEASKHQSSTSSFMCLHKTLLFSPLSARDILIWIISFACCFVSAMAGIGGGGLLLPLTIICLNFTTKEASVLSNTAVFANCCGQLLINNFYSVNQKNSSSSDTSSPTNSNSSSSTDSSNSSSNEEVEANTNPHRVFVSETTGTVLMMFPGLIAGGSIAITLQGLVPSTAIMILAFVTLTLATWKTYTKAKKMKQEEQQCQQKQQNIKQQDEVELSLLQKTNDIETDESNTNNDTKLVTDPTTTTTTTSETSRVRKRTRKGMAMDIDSKSGEEGPNGRGNRQDTNHHHSHHNKNCTCLICCNTISSYSLIKNYRVLELLIFSCWLFNAITFIARGPKFSNIIQRCSTVYYIIIMLPILFGTLFIACGRTLILKSQTCSYHRNLSIIGDSASIITTTSSTLANNNNAMEKEQTQEHQLLLRNNDPENLQQVTIQEEEEVQPGSNTGKDRLENNNTHHNHNHSNKVLAWYLPIIGAVIGLFAALLGIGGGELLGPVLLLVIKMNPQLSTRVTAVMSFLNSGTNTIHYSITNRITSPGYALLLGTAGFLGGSCGRILVTRISSSSRGGKNMSVFAFSLTIVLFIATCLIVYELYESPTSWSRKSVC